MLAGNGNINIVEEDISKDVEAELDVETCKFQS